MPRTYPAEVRRKVIELARSGSKIAQLAETFGMSDATPMAGSSRRGSTAVRSRAEHRGVPRPCRRQAPYQAVGDRARRLAQGQRCPPRGRPAPTGTSPQVAAGRRWSILAVSSTGPRAWCARAVWITGTPSTPETHRTRHAQLPTEPDTRSVTSIENRPATLRRCPRIRPNSARLLTRSTDPSFASALVRPDRRDENPDQVAAGESTSPGPSVIRRRPSAPSSTIHLPSAWSSTNQVNGRPHPGQSTVSSSDSALPAGGSIETTQSGHLGSGISPPLEDAPEQVDDEQDQDDHDEDADDGQGGPFAWIGVPTCFPR